MDYPIHIDTIRMELSLFYFKELQVKISIKSCISVPEDCFILANSADSDEMPPYAVFHLVFTVCQSTCLPISRMKRVKGPY